MAEYLIFVKNIIYLQKLRNYVWKSPHNIFEVIVST